METAIGNLFSAFAALMLMAAAPALPQTACRPDTLGNPRCVGDTASRPLARPPFPDPTLGLDGQILRPEAASRAPDLLPERRTNAFGDVLPAPGRPSAERPNPRCRIDSFGNLRCP